MRISGTEPSSVIISQKGSRPDLSINLSHWQSWFSTFFSFLLSPEESSNHFSRHLNGFCTIDGIISACTEYLCKAPFLYTSNTTSRLFGLNFILVYVTVSSRALRTNLAWTCVVTVRSSLKLCWWVYRTPTASWVLLVLFQLPSWLCSCPGIASLLWCL